MATAYFNLGDYKQSLRHFQVVVDSFPKSEFGESAKQNIEICRRRLGADQMEGAGSEPEPAVPDSGQAAPVPAPTQGDKQP